MDQTTKIFGVILAMFIVYITLKGELPAYMAVFTGNKTSTGSTT